MQNVGLDRVMDTPQTVTTTSGADKYDLRILPFSTYCPAGAVALLPENEVKICSPPKINFLHFTQRTPTNVFLNLTTSQGTIQQIFARFVCYDSSQN